MRAKVMPESGVATFPPASTAIMFYADITIQVVNVVEQIPAAGFFLSR
jgi:hypothetical protein